MPFGEVKLVPGVNVERTPTLLTAGYSVTSLARFKDSLIQKIGGWGKYFPFAVSGVPRDLHGWQDLNNTDRLLVGTTTQLGVITSASTFSDITPRQETTNPAVNFSTIEGSTEVTIVDNDVSGTPSIYDSIMINTPVSIGGLYLFGPYPIKTITGANSYKIDAFNPITGVLIASDQTETNAGTIPIFTTTSGSSIVSVNMLDHPLEEANQTVVFQATTTGNGITIFGHYSVLAITDANNFTIQVSQQATANGSFTMNGGLAQIVYTIAQGPPVTGSGYGLGGFGLGGFGVGDTGGTTELVGTAITADDWTSDNWGQIVLACPSGGGVYQWDPTGGFQQARLVVTAPPFNGGIFVSTTLQILFCWGSTQIQPVGVEQDPMLICWSDLEDFTEFLPSTTNQARNFRIPIGSVIRGGMAMGQQNLFWTDLDLWVASYAGFPFVFGFAKVGAGAGSISPHAMQNLGGTVYWMGPTNFYMYGGGAGVRTIPCSVWDVVFQNINRDFTSNVRAMPNTGFNEVGWFYPSSASANGENDSYVKYNLLEGAWDYGPMARSAWIDQTAASTVPLAATPTGVIYSHETTRDADGSAIITTFTTGYFYIAEGEEFAFVDQIIPDMKWDFFGGSNSASISISFNVINYPGDTPTTYGPYTMNSTTQYITTRFRGRQASVTITSSDVGSFWRLGKIRYRYSAVGRR